MEHKRSLEYEFVDREGTLVRSTREGLKPLGKTYGFFDCSASKEEIEAELPTIRDFAQTPETLELYLTEGQEISLKEIAQKASRGACDELDSDYSAPKQGKNPKNKLSRLARLLQRVDIGMGSGTKYTIEATLPNATNEKTADELSAILNQAYQSPLYQEGEEFRGEVVFERNGESVFRE